MALNEPERRVEPGSRDARRSARRSRMGILAQVALATLLATAAVLLVTWLSERRGFRARWDLTASGENTLDPKSIAVIEKLPDDVTIDVFFRPAEFPIHLVGAEAQDRMRKLLRRARDESGGRLTVEEHDLSDPGNLGARTEGRIADLRVIGVEPGGLFVVASGARRETVRLRPDVADIDAGNTDPKLGPFIPARLVNFRGEEALMSALLKVTQGASKKIVFTQGHGEPALTGGDAFGLSALKAELEGDGFEVATWDGVREGPLPPDTNLLAIIGPEQVFSAAEHEDVRAFVESGGHLIASPGDRPVEGEGSLVALLAEFGVKVRARGVVARPVPSVGGQLLYELEECGDLSIDVSGMPASNPITEPLRRAGWRVWLRRAHVLERGAVPPGGRVTELLRAPADSWHELPLPGTDDRFDWKPPEGAERARFAVAMQSSFPPRRSAPDRRADPTMRPESRVVVVGATSAFQNQLFLTNRDFVLNACNWLESREYRVMVSRTSPQARRIDVQAPGVLSRVHPVAVVLLPLACALLGLLTAWLRWRR